MNDIVRKLIDAIPFEITESRVETLRDNNYVLHTETPTHVGHALVTVHATALIALFDGFAAVSIRRSLVADFATTLEHEELADTPIYLVRKTVIEYIDEDSKRLLTRFLQNTIYRENVMVTLRDASDELVVKTVCANLPGQLADARITSENDTIYIVHEFWVQSNTNVVYTTHVSWTGTHVFIKTWRAFEVLYIGGDNEDEFLPWLWKETQVVSDYEAWVNIANHILTKPVVKWSDPAETNP